MLGAPGKAIRLMVGLQYLKFAFDEPDESLVARRVENPYWQYFCGFTPMRHQAPSDPSSMSRWRKRVGAERLQRLLKETIELAVRAKQLPKRDLAQITADTTAQEKNITYPTDSKLLYTAVRKRVDAAKAHGIRLRQSYLRVGKRAAAKAGRYAHAKRFKRMRKKLRKLRTCVGRLIRDIRRKAGEVGEDLTAVPERAKRIHDQQPRDSNTIYSWHEPRVRCISKGKARQRYEFGRTVAPATTNRRNWIVAARPLKDNPYDGHTLSETLEAAESLTGVNVRDDPAGVALAILASVQPLEKHRIPAINATSFSLEDAAESGNCQNEGRDYTASGKSKPSARPPNCDRGRKKSDNRSEVFNLGESCTT